MSDTAQKLAVVTGASTGIGFELAKIAVSKGYDVIVAADESAIETVGQQIGGKVEAVQADLSSTEGVDKLLAKIGGRPVDVLCANAGRGLGRAFVDQNWDDIRKLIDTNVIGTTYLLHKAAGTMKQRGQGKILITGSIAGLLPGTYQAVYNASKAFLDNLADGIRAELKESGVTVTTLMPGPTETEFFKTADMMDTNVGTQKKDDPAMVAQTGWEAMEKGQASVVSGLMNKVQAAISHVTPTGMLAERHRQLAEPGTAKS